MNGESAYHKAFKQLKLFKPFIVVLPEEKTMQVYALENNRYKIFNFAEIEGTVKPQIIKSLEVNIKEVFCD